MKTIDWRSDTVTLPTDRMREAMACAELGDDVYGEDPTVNRLEQLAAERFGKEAALLVASGTMGNLVAVLAHCGRGDEVILGDQSHTFYYEAGGIAALGGVHPHTIANQADGTVRVQDIEAAVRPDNVHFPRTRLVCLENTHNRCGGTALSAAYMDEVADLAARHHLALHLDGARIFNAAVALGTDVRTLAQRADSVTFCLSKGLAAPVGSVICGSEAFIAEARRVRKLVGGGMRQAGVIAAAGIVALEEMVDRLADDHANAAKLAERLARFDEIHVDWDRVQTNIVYFEVRSEKFDARRLVAELATHGILMLDLGPNCIRAVSHHGITDDDVEGTLGVMTAAIVGLSCPPD